MNHLLLRGHLYGAGCFWHVVIQVHESGGLLLHGGVTASALCALWSGHGAWGISDLGDGFAWKWGMMSKCYSNFHENNYKIHWDWGYATFKPKFLQQDKFNLPCNWSRAIKCLAPEIKPTNIGIHKLSPGKLEISASSTHMNMKYTTKTCVHACIYST